MRLPKAFWEVSADSLPRSARKIVDVFVEKFVAQGRSLYLYGPSSWDLNALAAVAAKRVRQLGLPVLYLPCFEVDVGFYRETFDETTLLDRAKSVFFLVLSDFGEEIDTKYVSMVLKYRLNELAPTLITSLLKPSELKRGYPDLAGPMKAVVARQVMATTVEKRTRKRVDELAAELA